MKVFRRKKITVLFGELEPGETFVFKGRYNYEDIYLKISDQSVDVPMAVNLVTGITDLVDDDEETIVVSGKFIEE